MHTMSNWLENAQPRKQRNAQYDRTEKNIYTTEPDACKRVAAGFTTTLSKHEIRCHHMISDPHHCYVSSYCLAGRRPFYLCPFFWPRLI